MKATFLISLFLMINLTASGQTDPITQVHGARNQGLGNIRIFDNTAFAYFNNPGALASYEVNQLAAGYDHRFSLSELSTINLAGAVSFGPGVLGFGIARFGGSLFNQQTVGISYANQLGIVSIGGKLEWFQTQIEGFGTGNAAIFSLGGIVDLSPTLSLGATISNLNRSKLGRHTDQRIPTGVSLGLNYRPGKQLNFYGEVEKDILINPVYKIGLAYELNEWIELRTGMNSYPGRLFFGLGLNYEKFGLDLGYGQINPLGSTTNFSLTFDLNP